MQVESRTGGKRLPSLVGRSLMSEVSAETGAVEINPRDLAFLHAVGLKHSTDFLNCPGEIVGGHVGRNVSRVILQGQNREIVGYLKREHQVDWKDRFKHAWEGFGFCSKSEREVRILQELELHDLPTPRWLAWGNNGSGKAFLLIQEESGSYPLKNWLLTNGYSKRLLGNLAQTLAGYHAAGFTQPDLLAKHVLVNSVTQECLCIDWQRSVCRNKFHYRSAIESLARLNASLPDALLSNTAKLYFLKKYCEVLLTKQIGSTPLAVLVRDIERKTRTFRNSRAILQESRQLESASEQRLIWLDGEALCLIPEIATGLSPDTARVLFYPPEERTEKKFCFAERSVRLLRESNSNCLRRLFYLKSLRRILMPMVTARIAFHLQRAGLAVPKLLAFGLDTENKCETHSFVLLEEKGVLIDDRIECIAELESRRKIIRECGELIQRIHEAGCMLRKSPCKRNLFRLENNLPEFEKIENLQYVRRVSEQQCYRSLKRLFDTEILFQNRTDRLRFLQAFVRGRKSPLSRKVLVRLVCQ
ncbi:hypothetical protein KIH39_03465 [Telmatocola sphagniphila]|uniref:Uncharacterized protein n=1 Tax=Telmatocola sphagniphila TaxID=1123043 RepID=A0A8E6B7W8_9BACT|nr:lipopolysaccharide kinase InaA family protein [Telmatocola sphagniphila]QVL32987.1 hypothetical protein KIH39_03465 [Telmatocola sphagniphila]